MSVGLTLHFMRCKAGDHLLNHRGPEESQSFGRVTSGTAAALSTGFAISEDH
jgi:hypothetical protein